MKSRRTAPLSAPLLRWYRANRRDLPWRRTSDPYRIWLSEIMLQQTRVEAVIPYYGRFLADFPTVQSLADAPIDEVLRRWAGLGYYSRARNLHAAAKLVATQHAGKFPDQPESLAELPGVGRYTAAAIASIAFGRRAAVLDGNVKRVLARCMGIRESIDSPATVRRLWTLAESLVPARSPGDFNQAMMELGATVCTPRKPHCDCCPLAQRCVAAKTGSQHEIPVRRKKPNAPTIIAACAWIERRSRVLLVQRPHRGLLGGLWELPGGPADNGEAPADALRRQGREAFGVTLAVGKCLGVIEHVFTHRRLLLHVFRARITKGEPSPSRHIAHDWFELDERTWPALATVDRRAMLLAFGECPGGPVHPSPRRKRGTNDGRRPSR
ncbi:MAG: A/G-specific adenine glycosylase [Planctomycetes bacterium]|nr:A/G-specific adenine glycosylase [Planctomycetota bacterium]